MRDAIVIMLLVTVICLCTLLLGMRLGYNSALDDNPLSSLTPEQFRQCLECDAPVWSDAWCESCYALWLEVK